MAGIKFTPNTKPTLGVELELQLADATTLELRSEIESLLPLVPPAFQSAVKREMVQSCVEINSKVCETVRDAEDDLRAKLTALTAAAARLSLVVLWGGTHPFSPWTAQKITNTPRYLGLTETLQDTGRRAVTFGFHVHVGVGSGDKAVQICQRLTSDLPLLLALSANSPFWCGRDTGLCSQRIVVWDTMPRAGLPPRLRDWSEYVSLFDQLQRTGFIEDLRSLWWNVRPHHDFGTVEVRICDMPATLGDALALTALVQCLVVAHSERLDGGASADDDWHPILVQQNKWRACRYGTRAQFADRAGERNVSAEEITRALLEDFRPVAKRLGCSDYLERLPALVAGPGGAGRQRETFARTKSLVQVARGMAAWDE